MRVCEAVPVPLNISNRHWVVGPWTVDGGTWLCDLRHSITCVLLHGYVAGRVNLKIDVKSENKLPRFTCRTIWM